MTKTARIILGILTIWPVIYFGLFIVAMLVMMLTEFRAAAASPSPEPPTWFFVLFAAHFATILWIFGLIAYYIVHVFRNDRIEGNRKALWAVVLFLGNAFAMPVYWYLYIWREPRQDAA